MKYRKIIKRKSFFLGKWAMFIFFNNKKRILNLIKGYYVFEDKEGNIKLNKDGHYKNLKSLLKRAKEIGYKK